MGAVFSLVCSLTTRTSLSVHLKTSAKVKTPFTLSFFSSFCTVTFRLLIGFLYIWKKIIWSNPETPFFISYSTDVGYRYDDSTESCTFHFAWFEPRLFFSKKRAALRAQSHDQEAGIEKIKTGLDFSYLFASSRCGRAFRSFKVGFVFTHAVYFVFYSTSFIILVVFSGTIHFKTNIKGRLLT